MPVTVIEGVLKPAKLQGDKKGYAGFSRLKIVTGLRSQNYLNRVFPLSVLDRLLRQRQS